MKNQNKKSIRAQLLFSLLVPLCTLWLISACVAFFLAVWFADDSYDHQLINSADSVAARLKSDGKKIVVDLPPAAQAILRHNDRDKFYYQILKTDGTRISGDAVLPGPLINLESEKPVLRYARLNQKEVRIARIRVDIPNYPERTILVQVAETLNSRRQLTQHIMLSMVIPQVILIGLSAFAIWQGVSSSLAPLRSLEQAVGERSQLDLTPVSESEAPSEVQPLVKAINNLLSRLSEDIESQRRFVANAAHQFRTPLAALTTYIYYAKKLPADKQMNETLDKIEASTERMSHLSNKLLALAKAEPSSRTHNLDLVDLNHIASEVTASFVAQAAKKELEISFVGSDNAAIVQGDPHSLSELTANLVENSVFYTPVRGQISINVLNDGDQMRLIVQDNGRGIPDNERQRVFERFYRILGTDGPGIGLGLPIVKEIAAAHAASISITNGPGGVGTTVTVSFPSKAPQVFHSKSNGLVLGKRD